MPDNENKVKVDDTDIGGDFTGRDKYNTTINHNYAEEKPIYLGDLYQKFQDEKEKDPVLRDFCEELDYYYSPIKNEKIIGLEAKLEAGNRGDILWYATDVKERFHKKLMKSSQYSEVAQDINVHLLSTVRAYFMAEIYPLVCKQADEQTINTLIIEKIVKPLHTELGINIFKYTKDDIQGMLYFLTGNCHIKWNK